MTKFNAMITFMVTKSACDEERVWAERGLVKWEKVFIYTAPQVLTAGGSRVSTFYFLEDQQGPWGAFIDKKWLTGLSEAE